MTTPIKPSTYFALLAEYGTPHVPLIDVAKKYFGLDEPKAKHKAARADYPFPIFRAGGQKSPWLVDIADLADYLDKVKNKTKQDKQHVQSMA